MACRRLSTPRLTLWLCDIDLHAARVAECEERYLRHELELDLERARALEWEEPEEIEVEAVPIHLVPDWARA